MPPRYACLLLASLPPWLFGAPMTAAGQGVAASSPSDDHSRMDHSGMNMDADMEHMDHAMPGMPMPADEPATPAMSAHSGHQMRPVVGDQPGNAPPPLPPVDHYADRVFSAGRMAAARDALTMHTRFTTLALQIDRLEYRGGNGKGGYGWEGTLWYGGDIDRLVFASEGEGSFRQKAERIELHAYWRHAVDPWFNLQLGVRHDVRPDPQRTYAMVGIEGLAPFWIDLEGNLLLSDRGDTHVRAKASYQQRITQSFVIEPEVEVDFAFQDVPELNVGAGFERVELGARLRFERDRSFAPYLGVHWERKLGGTAQRVRILGDDTSQVSAVVGIRAMF